MQVSQNQPGPVICGVPDCNNWYVTICLMDNDEL